MLAVSDSPEMATHELLMSSTTPASHLLNSDGWTIIDQQGLPVMTGLASPLALGDHHQAT